MTEQEGKIIESVVKAFHEEGYSSAIFLAILADDFGWDDTIVVKLSPTQHRIYPPTVTHPTHLRISRRSSPLFKRVRIVS